MRKRQIIISLIIINTMIVTNVVCQESLCHLQAVTGKCRGYILRYYYKVDTDSCVLFAWGGCGGNENNFQEIEECEEMCKIVKRRPQSYSSLGRRSRFGRIPRPESYSSLGRRSRFGRIPRPESYSSLGSYRSTGRRSRVPQSFSSLGSFESSQSTRRKPRPQSYSSLEIPQPKINRSKKRKHA